MNRRKRGSSYEQAAVVWLERHGYEIVATNYRYSRTEIDVICCKDGELVFVEVKGQRSDCFGDARHKVDARKQKAIIETAKGFIASTPANYDSYRFDVIVVTEKSGELQIEQIKGAFTL